MAGSKTKKTPSRAAAQKSGKPGGVKRLTSVQPFSQRTRTGTLFLLTVLLALSVLAGVRLEPAIKVFSVGQVATQDVTATRDLLVEEKNSTEIKREEAARNQPPMFDLNMDKAQNLESRVAKVYAILDKARMNQMDQARWQISDYLNADISRQTLNLLRNNETRNLVFIRIIPWLMEQLRRGVVLDSRMLQRYDNGIIVRDVNLARTQKGTESPTSETLRLDIYQILDLAGLRRRLDEYLRQDLDKSWRTRKAFSEFLNPFLEPSLTLNPEATQERIERARQAVDPVYYNIKRGEIVVRAGQRVDEQIHLKLQALSAQEQQTFEWYGPLGIMMLGVLFTIGLTLRPTGPMFKALDNRDALLIGSVILLFAGPARLLSAIDTVVADKWLYVTPDMFPFSFPMAGAAGLLALFLSPRLCLFAFLLLSFLVCQMIDAGLNIFLFYFLSSMLQMVLIKRAETRQEVLKSVPPLVVGMLLVWLAVNFLQFHGVGRMGMEAVFVIVNALASLLAVFALSPIVEMAFGYTSRFRLMEMMNLEQPLLQELMVAVPGTYHHSLIVANMVEAGARNIGANALLCKVAALYHDVGKLKSPQYFIENQFGIKNPHDKLAPSMSALILISHVKKGVELARQHKLGPEITDIIQQHHGTSLIAYFHNKALEVARGRDETVREEDYRYPGPKPQTKEAGIVMLADAIEASSRTLIEPTPSRIKGHIQGITRKIFSEGELDESMLTLKDLHILGEAFHKILTGIFHQRIEYPSQGREQRAKQQTKNAVAGPLRGSVADDAAQRAPEVGPPEPSTPPDVEDVASDEKNDEELRRRREPLQ